MAEMLEASAGEDIPCKDPDCDGMAEPEVDGDHKYYTCSTCGFDFGWEKVEGTQIEGNCSVGVPESIRRKFSDAPQMPSMEPEPVKVSIGRRS